MRAATAALVLVTTAGPPAARGTEPPRPNVVLLMADDQGWGDVGFRGHPRLSTPALDELARTAVRFERFYAAAPVCSPTRGSCLTGRHPDRYGIGGANDGHLPASEVTIAERLRDAGYRTGHFGKWHLGTLTRTERDSNRGGPRGAEHYAPPWEHGFDRCFSTEAKVPTHDPMVTPPRWAGGVGDRTPGEPYGTAYWDESGRRVTEDLAGEDSALLMDRALAFVEDAVAAGDPFLAVVWFHAPHLPVVAGPRHLEPYADEPERERQHYWGCLTGLDAQVGRLRARLAELGVARDTLLWYCSDNGPETTAVSPGTTGGLRGRKRSLFEGGLRVPAFLEWPARFPESRVVLAPCSTSDVLPTVLDAVGLEPPDRPLDGASLLPWIDGGRGAPERGLGFRSGARSAWIGARYKLHVDGDEVRLFDLAADPAETTDVAREHPDVAAAYRAELERWRASCAASARGADGE